MIIKSMARKTPSFGQLIGYMSDIDKSDEQYNVYQNLFSRKDRDIEQEFMRNAQRVIKRKNGNYMYHEILSISKAEKLSDEKQKQILRNIAYEYSKRRASENLVFGTLHDDHENHLHYHLIISANAVGESKKTRLTKRDFDQLKKGMEQRVLENHPELEQKLIIGQKANERLSRKGSERKRRTGQLPERDALKAKLQDIFSHCKTKQEFLNALSEAGLELYIRGQTIGIKNLATNRNHRLKTLGLLDDFQIMSDRISLDEAATKEQERASNYKQEKTSPPPEPEGQPHHYTQKNDDPKEHVIKDQHAIRKAEMEKMRQKKTANKQVKKQTKKNRKR